MNKKQISLIILLSVLCMMPSTYAKEVKPINTTSLVTDISSLKVPESTQIVGLGEASHGVSEYQKMKADVFKALVANNNSYIFIIEGDFGGCLKVEEYIHGGRGTAQEAVSEIGFAIYRTQEIVDLVEWMRSYNKTAAEGEDLHFYGMDMQRYDNNKDYLFSVLDASVPGLSEQYRVKLSSLTDEMRLTLSKAILKQSEEDVLALLKEMDKQKPQISKAVGEDAFNFARECAKSIYECSKLTGSNTNYNALRDNYMAEKVKWFIKYNEAKYNDGNMLFINGHNGHIGKVSAYGYPCLGEVLTKEYGDNYFAIGTDAVNTRFNSQQDNGFAIMEVKNSNSLTAFAEDVNSAYYYLDFATVRENEAWQSMITNPQKMTAFNVGITKWQEKFPQFFTQQLIPAKAYNGVIIFREVTPSTLLQ